MAGNQEIVDFPLLSAPIGSEVYGVKSDTDYRVAVGSALGIATLGADGKLDAAQVPAGGASGTVTSVGLATTGSGLSLTGASPITTTGSWSLELSANLQAWSALATSAKADTSHVHAAGDVTSGTFAAARLGSGTANSTKYLRGDLTWQDYSGGGGGGGTVTSVDITGSTGITPSGGPVTTSGSITLTLSANLQAWSALATSAKANTSHTHAAGDVTSGVLGTARLGSGTADSTKYLRGDGTWVTLPAGGSGTVTSVDFSGGTTGLSASGGPITSAGTFTLNGVLIVANGGTGASTLTGYVKGSGTAALTASSTIPGADISGNISGNAATATSAATWTTSRTLTIGSTGKSVNGSGNVSWTIAEVGAVANGGNLTTATKLTQAAYTALGTPDANTLYIIVG